MKKFSSFLIVLLLMLASFTAGVEYPRGDVNYDGQVNVTDVTCLINYLLTDAWPDEPVSPDEHEYVDLGLPSGTLWATCNVGADNPEDYGDYFAWGETAPKEVYSWTNYKWCNGTHDTLTKYCSNSDYGANGFVDNKTELDLDDDAAYVNWGENWRMPTLDQQTELRTECTWTWTTQNGVNGYLVTGPNGNSLFLPAAGGCYAWLYDAGSWGYYWSHTLYSTLPYGAYGVSFNSDLDVGWDFRYAGHSVRAVRVSQN